MLLNGLRKLHVLIITRRVDKAGAEQRVVPIEDDG